MKNNNLKDSLYYDYIDYKSSKWITECDMDTLPIEEAERITDKHFKNAYRLINKMMDTVQSRVTKQGQKEEIINPLIDRARKSIVEFDDVWVKILRAFRVYWV